MKKWFMTAVAFVSTLTLVACGSGSSEKTATQTDNWETYEKTKSITIGFDNTFVPMGFEDESGKTVGFDIDLANAIFKDYGITVKWQPINWDMKETELNNGNIDLIWNGYSLTPERQEKVLFSDVYMETEEVIVTKKTSGIQTLSDMADKILGAQSGSSGYEAFLGNPKVLKDIVKDNDATQYETFTQAFIDLKNDRIDAIIVDKVYANYYLKQEGESDNYLAISADLESGDFAVGARQSDKTLITKINDGFKKLYQKGDYQAISTKWFGEDTASSAVKGN